MCLQFSQTSSPINVLLTHLSSVDLILCVSVLVSMLPEMFNQYEQVAEWLCPVHGFLFTFLHPMAIWTVCGLNCDRSVLLSVYKTIRCRITIENNDDEKWSRHVYEYPRFTFLFTCIRLIRWKNNRINFFDSNKLYVIKFKCV